MKFPNLVPFFALTFLAATQQPVAAQRPFRIALGVTPSQSYNDGGGQRDASAYAWQISYDLPRKAALPGSRTVPLTYAVYYDSASYIDNVSEKLFEFPSENVYSGLGASARAVFAWGYAGTGIGLYNGTVGGKIFAGLQGRGSLFLETSLTRLVRPTEAGNPGPVFSIGTRF